jgi:hypothetical protein
LAKKNSALSFGKKRMQTLLLSCPATNWTVSAQKAKPLLPPEFSRVTILPNVKQRLIQKNEMIGKV